jgi:hypothetical protein
MSHSDSAQVRSVVERYFADLEAGKGAAACALFTNQAKEELRPLYAFSEVLGRGSGCTPLMTLEAKAVAGDSTRLQELKDTKVEGVTLNGDRATVVLGDPARGLHGASLVKTPEGWRISKQMFRVRKPIAG